MHCILDIAVTLTTLARFPARITSKRNEIAKNVESFR